MRIRWASHVSAAPRETTANSAHLSLVHREILDELRAMVDRLQAALEESHQSGNEYALMWALSQQSVEKLVAERDELRRQLGV